VRGLALVNSARWCSHVLACANVDIERVTIRNRIRENRDGIDIDSCDGVRLRDCHITSGDDAIVLKSTVFGKPCRNVAVRDCLLSGAPSCLKLGTESQCGLLALRRARRHLRGGGGRRCLPERGGLEHRDAQRRDAGLHPSGQPRESGAGA
jgi:hypothetical protein